MHRRGYVMVKALVLFPLWTVTIIDFCIIIIFKYITAVPIILDPPPCKVDLFSRHHLTIFALLGDPEPLPKHSPPLNYHLIRRFLAREDEKKVCCSQGGRVKVYWNGCKMMQYTVLDRSLGRHILSSQFLNN